MASKKKKRNPANPDAINSDLINLQLERKNSQQALDSAKYYHKQNRSLQSEELLAAAYQLRIRQLKASNLVKEAVQLIAVAKEKCPHFTDLFDITESETFQFPLAMQDVQRLIGLTQSHTTSHKKTESLQESLKKGLSDPRHLLQCEELAAAHPLKQEAAIVMEAFEAAADECPQLEREQRLHRLAQVPRRSILADWCYLVRALDAFHRFDDQQAQLYVDRISKDSAASRAAIFLQVQLEGKLIPKGLSSKPARLLWNSMTEDSLRTH